MSKNKIVSFDVLRGLACLVVVFYHVFMINPFFADSYFSKILLDNYLMNSLLFTPLKIIWDGHAAVVLFFILSGFVLSISFFRKSKMNYNSYFVKRVCRIYLPLVVLIAIGSIGSNYFQNYERLSKFSEVINGQWGKIVSISTFFNYIFFKDYNIIYLSNSIWSLPIELKVSLFLPFIIVTFKKIEPRYDLLLVLLNMIVYHGGNRLGLQEIIPEFALLYYLTFFMAGIVLYKHHEIIVFKISKLDTKIKKLLYLVALLLYTNYSNIVVLFPKLVSFLEKVVPADYLITLGSILLMALVLAEDANNSFWSNRYLVYIGKISFSLYLIHPIIMMIVCLTLGSVTSLMVLYLLCIVGSLAASVFFYNFIELPTQNLGIRLTEKMKK